MKNLGSNEAVKFTILDGFYHNLDLYYQVLYINDDDRAEILDSDFKTLLIFTADCHVKTPDGKHLGRFQYMDKRIVFKPNDEEGVFKGLSLEVVEKSEAIFELEKMVFIAWYRK